MGVAYRRVGVGRPWGPSGHRVESLRLRSHGPLAFEPQQEENPSGEKEDSMVLPYRLVIISLITATALHANAVKDVFKIAGFSGRSSTEAASGVTINLLDGESGAVLGSVRTGFTGRYKFEDLKPGRYILQSGDMKREVQLKSKDIRLDIDLSAKDGTMRYAKPEDIQSAIAGAAGGASGAAAPPAGPNDVPLMMEFAGNYWGYSGSTESSLVLCPEGTFTDSSESSYSGTMRDGLGTQTGAWGSANQRSGQGKWSIQGNGRQGTIYLSYPGGKQSQVSYRQVDQGCYSFNGRTLCRKGPAACR